MKSVSFCLIKTIPSREKHSSHKGPVYIWWSLLINLHVIVWERSILILLKYCYWFIFFVSIFKSQKYLLWACHLCWFNTRRHFRMHKTSNCFHFWLIWPKTKISQTGLENNPIQMPQGWIKMFFPIQMTRYYKEHAKLCFFWPTVSTQAKEFDLYLNGKVMTCS